VKGRGGTDTVQRAAAPFAGVRRHLPRRHGIRLRRRPPRPCHPRWTAPGLGWPPRPLRVRARRPVQLRARCRAQRRPPPRRRVPRPSPVPRSADRSTTEPSMVTPAESPAAGEREGACRRSPPVLHRCPPPLARRRAWSVRPPASRSAPRAGDRGKQGSAHPAATPPPGGPAGPEGRERSRAGRASVPAVQRMDLSKPTRVRHRSRSRIRPPGPGPPRAAGPGRAGRPPRPFRRRPGRYPPAFVRRPRFRARAPAARLSPRHPNPEEPIPVGESPLLPQCRAPDGPGGRWMTAPSPAVDGTALRARGSLTWPDAHRDGHRSMTVRPRRRPATRRTCRPPRDGSVVHDRRPPRRDRRPLDHATGHAVGLWRSRRASGPTEHAVPLWPGRYDPPGAGRHNADARPPVSNGSTTHPGIAVPDTGNPVVPDTDSGAPSSANDP